MAVIGFYDLRHPIFGDVWHLWWAATGVVLILWFYYAVLVARASIQIRPDYLRLQGPLFGMNISYGRVHSVTASNVSQHFPPEMLRRSEAGLAESMRGRTAVFVELRSLPVGYRSRRLWFPRLVFGTTRQGLLLAVEDWLAVSRDVEVARDQWRHRHFGNGRYLMRTPAAEVLGY